MKNWQVTFGLIVEVKARDKDHAETRARHILQDEYMEDYADIESAILVVELDEEDEPIQ